MVDGIQLTRGKCVVAAIGFRDTLIYPTRCVKLTAGAHRRYRSARPLPQGSPPCGESRGHLQDDSPEYWREVSESKHRRRGRFCCRGKARAGQMRLSTGCPTPRSTARMSLPEWWPMSEAISITWMTLRSSGSLSVTLPGPRARFWGRSLGRVRR